MLISKFTFPTGEATCFTFLYFDFPSRSRLLIIACFPFGGERDRGIRAAAIMPESGKQISNKVCDVRPSIVVFVYLVVISSTSKHVE